MAGVAPEIREIPYLRLFPWIRLFRGVRLALDAKKMILAALGLGLFLAGWGVCDALFHARGPADSPLVGDLLPSPFEPRFGLAQTLWEAAADVADPPRRLIWPFLEMFGFEPAPGVFWHGLLLAVWAVVVWGITGGAIARIAVVQLAGGEPVGIAEAVRFALRRAGVLITAPLTPLVGVAFFTVPCVILGVGYRVPSSFLHGVLGVFAFIPLLLGLAMALILAGLAVGWPLMHVAVAAEGEDAFDAISRSYAYVLERPARLAAYTALAWLLGIAGVLLVGVFERGVVRLALWGLSFGAPEAVLGPMFERGPLAERSLPAGIHGSWLTLVDLLAYGWIYSYFWTSASIIYLLLRHEVDGTDWHDLGAPPIDRTAAAFDLTEPDAGDAAPETERGGEGPAPEQAARPMMDVGEAPRSE